MKKEQNNILIGIIFLVYALMIPAYIYTYQNFSSSFWGIFVIERIISLLYVNTVEEFLQKSEESDSERYLTYFMMVLALCATGAFIYVIFVYPRLFIILIIGELLDKCLEKVQSSINAVANIEHAQYKK